MQADAILQVRPTVKSASTIARLCRLWSKRYQTRTSRGDHWQASVGSPSPYKPNKSDACRFPNVLPLRLAMSGHLRHIGMFRQLLTYHHVENSKLLVHLCYFGFQLQLTTKSLSFMTRPSRGNTSEQYADQQGRDMHLPNRPCQGAEADPHIRGSVRNSNPAKQQRSRVDPPFAACCCGRWGKFGCLSAKGSPSACTRLRELLCDRRCSI